MDSSYSDVYLAFLSLLKIATHFLYLAYDISIIHFGSPSVVWFALRTFGCILIIFCIYVIFDLDALASVLVPTIVIITDPFVDVNYRFPSNSFVNFLTI